MATALRPGLTAQQERAITAGGISVALSAGAGCGKTFVLTERFLAALEPSPGEQGIRLDQLTAITFTERAAREMRDRIRAACARRLLDAPPQQVDHWLRLIRELDMARISTIHSFCGSLLRAHAVEAGLDPRFSVLDQSQADTLLYELIDRELRRRLALGEEAVLELVVQFALAGLRDMVAQLLAARQDIDWPQWRKETVDGLLGRWEDYWRNDTVPRAAAKIARSPAAARLLAIIRATPPSLPAMLERCAALAEGLSCLQSQAAKGDTTVSPLPPGEGPGVREKRSRASPAIPPHPLPLSQSERGESPNDVITTLASIRENAKVQGGGGKKAWPSEDIYESFRDAAAELRGLIDQTQKRLAFEAEAARPAAETALRLLAVCDGVAAAYEAEKRDLAALDFDDLLIRARDLLLGPNGNELRNRLAAQIKLLLVDEFQDTDPLQVELLRALCDGRIAGGKLFLVGDYKQSIYRFRGARPEVFKQLRREIPRDGRLSLSRNFRSQPAVLDFINALFCSELRDNGEDGDEAEDYEPLVAAHDQVAPRPAVEFLWATEPDEDENAGDSEISDPPPTAQNSPPQMEQLRRLEADWIARRLRAMLDSGEKIVWNEEAAAASRPAARAVRPGDIAILFRALTNVEYYEEALRRYGIDYYLVGGHAFYAQQEIYDLVNLLRALANPGDAVSLIGVLRSPMFALLDETLFWLGQHPEGVPGGLMAETLPPELSTEQAGRVRRAAATLAELRSLKDRLSVAELIRRSLAQTGYDAVLLAEFLGERKLANLHKLIDDARSFDQSGIFTLADFITQLSQFIIRQPDEPLAATHPESVDVVRLMSIHQAKGLEFPVVVVADLDRPRRGPLNRVAFTPQLGPMLNDPDSEATSGYDLFWLSESDQEQAELVRLLYVATTRAADYLILSSSLRGPGTAKGPWTELLFRHFDPSSGEPLISPLPPGDDHDHALHGARGARGVRGIALGPPTALAKVTASQPPLDMQPAAGLGATAGLSSSVVNTVGQANRGTLQVTSAGKLARLVKEAERVAAEGGGRTPKYLAAVPPDLQGRRQYSFSRLSGGLHGGAGKGVRPHLPERPFGCLAQMGSDPFSQPGDDMDADAEPRLDPRGLGTLVHAVLADLDPSRPDDVPALVHRHAPRHLQEGKGEGKGVGSLFAEHEMGKGVRPHLPERPFGCFAQMGSDPFSLDEPIEMIRRLLASPRGAALATAAELHRELEFLLAWPPGSKDPEAPLLQGFIDCIYRDAAGGWHLIDYKTNQVTAAEVARVAVENYQMQMLVYGLAAERILGCPPVELAICFLRPGEEYYFTWDAAARQQAVNMVEEAISAATW